MNDQTWASMVAMTKDKLALRQKELAETCRVCSTPDGKRIHISIAGRALELTPDQAQAASDTLRTAMSIIWLQSLRDKQIAAERATQ